MAQGDLFSSLNSNNYFQNAASANVSSARQNRDVQQILANEMAILQTKRKIFDLDKKSNSLLKDASKMLKDAGKKHKEFEKSKKAIKDLDKEIKGMEKLLEKEREKQRRGERNLVAILEQQTQEREYQASLARVQNDQMRRALPLGGKMAGAFGRINKVVKGTSYTMNTISDTLSGIHGLFDMLLAPLKIMGDLLTAPWKKFLEIQSITGNLAADIGLTAKETYKFKDDFALLANSALKFGGSMQDVATAMRVFSDETGRNRMFDTKVLGQLIELGNATGLGVEGAVQMAGMFDNMGISLERGIQLTDNARQVAAKYNLNSTKLLQNLGAFAKQLNGHEFKNGINGLTKIVAQAQSLRFDLSNIGSVAQKLFDPEGAIEASAQLNVLGGRFAQMGDPFGLMYAAQNAPEELAKGIMDVTKGMAKRGKDGNFFISAADRMMIQQAAGAIGENADNLINAALEQGKLADKLAANPILKKGIFDEDQLQALGNLVSLKNGQYVIRMPEGYDRVLSTIPSKSEFDRIIEERSKNEKAAIERKNWSERLSLIFEKFMIGFTKPFSKLESIFNDHNLFEKIEGLGQLIADKLVPWIDGIFSGDGKIFKFIDGLVTEISKTFDSVMQFFNDSNKPFLTTLAEGLGKLFIKLIDVITPYMQWGFGKLIETLGGILPGWMGGDSMKASGMEMQYRAGSKNSNIGSMMGFDKGGQGAYQQQMLGAYGKDSIGWGTYARNMAAGAAIGSIIPGVGTLVGAGIGGLYGLYQKMNEQTPQERLNSATKVNDGVITSTGQVIKYPKGELLSVMSPQQNGVGGGGNTALALSGTIRLETPVGDTNLTMEDFKRMGMHVIANAISHEQSKSEKGYGLNDSKDIRTTLAI